MFRNVEIKENTEYDDMESGRNVEKFGKNQFCVYIYQKKADKTTKAVNFLKFF